MLSSNALQAKRLSGLYNQANQDTVDTIIGIVDNVAKSEIVENSNKISESEKQSIEKTIDNATRLSEETKNKLKEMFGIKSSTEPDPTDPVDPTPEP